MLTVKARLFVNMVVSLLELERFFSKQRGPVPPGLRQRLQDESTAISQFAQGLHIPLVADAALSIREASTFDELRQQYGIIKNIVMLSLNDRKFYEPEQKYLEYFENLKLFGDAVFDAFPSATDDIAEAGTCLALERSTACVMHLMRATEVALNALAGTVNVTKQDNWGATINEINKELERRFRAAGKHTPEEDFYSEAATQIDHVKRAWRNKALHIEKSYSQPRAEEILLATKSLMNHLAARISE